MALPAYDHLTKAGEEAIRHRNRAKIILTISLIFFLVGIVVAVLIVVNHKNAEDNAEEKLQQTLPLDELCIFTDFRVECLETFQKLQFSGGLGKEGTPKAYFQVALNATIDEIKIMSSSVDQLAKGSTDGKALQAHSSCKQLLQFADEELQEAFNIVSSSEGQTSFADHSDDLRNWLSAAVTYEMSCGNGFMDPRLSEKVYAAVNRAYPITSNALAIICNITRIFGKANIDYPGAPRRLMGQEEEWGPLYVPERERRLVGSTGEIPNAVVAKDGSGEFKTITAALNAMPKNHEGRYVIYVKAGIYDEIVEVSRDMVDVLMYGDGPTETIVTGNRSRTSGYVVNSATFCESLHNICIIDEKIKQRFSWKIWVPEVFETVMLRFTGL